MTTPARPPTEPHWRMRRIRMATAGEPWSKWSPEILSDDDMAASVEIWGHRIEYGPPLPIPDDEPAGGPMDAEALVEMVENLGDALVESRAEVERLREELGEQAILVRQGEADRRELLAKHESETRLRDRVRVLSKLLHETRGYVPSTAFPDVIAAIDRALAGPPEREGP